MTEEHILGYEILEEENNLMLAAEGYSWRGFAEELQELHYLKGVRFINQLKQIIYYGEFHPVEGEESDDYENLLNAARKAVEHGYCVFILPNPKGIRTADFIFERKGVYKMFDLKTISGKNSVGNRLKESVGQTNCVLLNLLCLYNVRNLTLEIKRYFELSSDAQEILIFLGKKEISIKRNIATSKGFLKMMMNSFRK